MKIVLYPTDTLYGLGVDATNPEAVLRLQDLKGRGEEKPISIVVSDLAMMKNYAIVTPLAERLITQFLPGKLTLVLCSKPGFQTPGVVGADGSVGIRIPNHPTPLRLVRELGKPITATSANVSGMVPESTPQKILAQFKEKASWITEVFDEGALPENDASTVVDARGDKPVILREGAIAVSEIM
ncbi:MAG: L-threonylcarbamoyladenylate synthase [Patescibacteria group bacterium]|mgnify:CR=1 FL=1